MKKVIISTGILGLLVLSGGAFATDTPYQVSDVGKIVSCVAKPAGQGICKSFNIAPDPSAQYNYNNGDNPPVFTEVDGGTTIMQIPFVGNAGNDSVCALFSMSGGPIVVEPITYCQDSSNSYMLVSTSANYDTTSGDIGAKENIDVNVAGLVSMKIKVDDMQYSPEK